MCFDGLKQEIDSVSAFTLSLSGSLGHPFVVICTINYACAFLCACAHTHTHIVLDPTHVLADPYTHAQTQLASYVYPTLISTLLCFFFSMAGHRMMLNVS